MNDANVNIDVNANESIDSNIGVDSTLDVAFANAQSLDAEFTSATSLEATLSTGDSLEVDLGTGAAPSDCKVLYNTTEFWNSTPQLIAQRGYLYVYSDYEQDDGKNIAGIKAGDGTSYLIDMPFIDKIYADHVRDVIRHITDEERTFWNNKVRCYIEDTTIVQGNNLIFTTH